MIMSEARTTVINTEQPDGNCWQGQPLHWQGHHYIGENCHHIDEDWCYIGADYYTSL